MLGLALDAASPDVPEVQSLDFATVALAKVRAAREALGDPPVPVFVDDSGLVVEAWNGFPGALTKWLLQSVGTEGLLAMLRGFPDRSARAVCVVAVSDARGETQAFKGEVRGKITTEPRGTEGFGYDPVFRPDGSDLTYAELGDEKHRLSHRAVAFQSFKGWLEGRAKGRERDV